LGESKIWRGSDRAELGDGAVKNTLKSRNVDGGSSACRVDPMGHNVYSGLFEGGAVDKAIVYVEVFVATLY